MGVKVTDRDRGYKKLVRRLRQPAPPVTVGIHAAEGAKGYPESETTVLDVAIWNEFGTRNVPERSFIRAWFDESKDRFGKIWLGLWRKVVKGQLSAEQAGEQLGAKAVGEIQARISQGIPPPNAESTVKRKGSSKPLIDTGVLRSSITWKIGDQD